MTVYGNDMGEGGEKAVNIRIQSPSVPNYLNKRHVYLRMYNRRDDVYTRLRTDRRGRTVCNIVRIQ